MKIINLKTRLFKIINLADFTPENLYEIYIFYSNHKNFTVLTKF